MSAGLHPGNFVRLVAALALLAASLVQAHAQSDGDAATRAQRLDGLFAVLKTAKDQDEADAIAGDIWKVWLQSGSARSGRTHGAGDPS